MRRGRLSVVFALAALLLVGSSTLAQADTNEADSATSSAARAPVTISLPITTANTPGSNGQNGILTMRGVSKPVTLVGTYNGKITDPWGKERIAFEATGRINRKDFGLAWSRVVEGTALVGDEVDIDIAIEAVKN